MQKFYSSFPYFCSSERSILTHFLNFIILVKVVLENGPLLEALAPNYTWPWNDNIFYSSVRKYVATVLCYQCISIKTYYRKDDMFFVSISTINDYHIY